MNFNQSGSRCFGILTISSGGGGGFSVSCPRHKWKEQGALRGSCLVRSLTMKKAWSKKEDFPATCERRLHQPVAVEMQQQAWPMLPDHSNSRSFDWQNRWPNVGPYIRALIVPPKKGGARLSKCHERSRSELHRAQTPDPLHLQWLSTLHLSQSNVGLSEQILGKTPNSNGLSWIIMQFQILICYSHF